MTYKIKNILSWYNKYNKLDVIISTHNNKFELELSSKQISHLIGVHYTLNKDNKITGKQLYNYIKNKSDEQIYSLIKKNNPRELNDVKERINNFKYFMENLESATLYEQTHKNTKIKSIFLLVKKEDNSYLQLGIAKNRNYTDYLETFLVRKDNNYIKNSKIKEKVISIETYNEQDELIPFSFNEEKNKKLLEEYYKNKNNQNKQKTFKEKLEEKLTTKQKEKEKNLTTKEKNINIEK